MSCFISCCLFGQTDNETYDISSYKAIVAEYNKHYYSMTTSATSSSKFSSKEVIMLNNKVYCDYDTFKSLAWQTETVGENTTIKTINGDYLSYKYSTDIVLNSTSYNWYVNTDNQIVSYKSVTYAISLNLSSPNVFGAYKSGSSYKVASLYDFATDNDNLYTRIGLSAGKIGTICLPFSVPTTDNSGAKFYSIVGKRVDATGTPTDLIIQEVTSLTKCCPYIFIAYSSEFNLKYEVDYTLRAADSNNGLCGSLGLTSVASGNYLINDNKVVKCGSDCYIVANRAYIKMDDVPEYKESYAKCMVLNFNGVVTNLQNVEETITDDVMYNMCGQRVGSDTKGLVIVNGRKMFNK